MRFRMFSFYVMKDEISTYVLSCKLFAFDVEYRIWAWLKHHSMYLRTIWIEWKHLYKCPCQNEGVGLNFAEWLICTSLPWFLRKVFGIISFKTMFLASSYFYSIGMKEHLQMRVSFDNNFGTAHFFLCLLFNNIWNVL